MTRPVTQVGPRLVKAGLGGHDDGVGGVAEGVENASLPLRKWGRAVLSECPTFSDFRAAEKDSVGEG